MQPLRITAHTITSCLGHGVAPTAAALRDGRSGLAPCDFETADLDTWIGRVDGVEDVRLPDVLARFDCRNNRLAALALEADGFDAAVQDAIVRHGADRVGVFVGTSTSGILQTELAYRLRSDDGPLPGWFRYGETHNTYSLADYLSHRYGLAGPALVVSAACASSAKVFGNASRMIAAGRIDAALVGGVDSLCLTTLYGFRSLELVSTRPAQPYGATRDGLSIGEAGAFLLLERDDAADRVAPRVFGVGESSDAHHMSSPHPEGLGARTAMRAALDDAALEPAAIDYVNLHGTATPANDAAEDRAVTDLFGTGVPLSSTKGATGHTLGAAGAAEAVVCLIALEHGFVPGGVNTVERDPALRGDYRLASVERPLSRVLSNSFGFGGANCALVLGST